MKSRSVTPKIHGPGTKHHSPMLPVDLVGEFSMSQIDI